MNFPENLKYTKEHEWVKVDGDIATVGVTDFAQGELGDIVFVEIETQGETLNEGETFGTVEAVKTVSDLYMPVGGEVLEVNPDLVTNPQFVNEDPYNKGWMIKIKMDKVTEFETLLNSVDYQKLTGH